MVRFGIVGTGIMGNLYARLIHEHPSAEVKAVAGITRESVEELASKYGAQPFLKHREMYESGEIDAVYIATPDFAHAQVTEEALEAGLHVLLEKPMTTNLQEAERLARLAENRQQQKAMIRFGNRWSPPYLQAKSALKNGTLGNVLAIHAGLHDTIYVPTKMLSWSYMTTPAWFLMSHTLDAAFWLLGRRAEKVYATGSKRRLLELGIDTYDLIQAQVTFKGGVTGIFSSGWVYPNSMPTTVSSFFEVVGDRGSIFLNLQHQTVALAEKAFKFPSILMSEVDGRMEGYLVHTLNAFIRAIEEELPSPVPFADGLENVRILDAVHRSLESGEVVYLDHAR